jgi:hypothetical protein
MKLFIESQRWSVTLLNERYCSTLRYYDYKYYVSTVDTSISTSEIRNIHRLQYKSCLLCSNINLIYAIDFIFMANKTLFEKMNDQKKKLSLISGMLVQKFWNNFLMYFKFILYKRNEIVLIVLMVSKFSSF